MSRVFLRETKTADREVNESDGSSTVWRCMSKETMYIKLENFHKHRIPKRIIYLYKKSVHELLKHPVYRRSLFKDAEGNDQSRAIALMKRR